MAGTRKDVERQEKLNGSYATAYAQRAVLAGFLLDTLGRKFVQRKSCRDLIGPAAYRAIGKGSWSREEKDTKLFTDAARYFHDWFELRKAAQPATLRAFIDSSPYLSYLRGLENIPQAGTRVGNAPNHLLLLLQALRAFELDESVGAKNAFATKAALARGILRSILENWTPDESRSINLDEFRIGGWGAWAKGDRHGAGAAFKGMKIYQDRTRFYVSEEVARSFHQRLDIGVVDYLLSLAMDYEPLLVGVHLRWGMDLFTAALAARCLLVCEAMPESIAKKGERTSTLSFDAEGLDGLMEMFCVRADALKPRSLFRLFERIPCFDQAEREARTVWCVDSLKHGAKLFRSVTDMLTPGPKGFVAAWEKFSPKLPSAASTNSSAPVERAIAAAEAEHDSRDKMDTFLSTLEREQESKVKEPPAPPYANVAHLELGSDPWRIRMEAIIDSRMDHAKHIYERATSQNRRPSREEYIEIVKSLPETRADIRAVTPTETMANIRRALIGVKKQTRRSPARHK